MWGGVWGVSRGSVFKNVCKELRSVYLLQSWLHLSYRYICFLLPRLYSFSFGYKGFLWKGPDFLVLTVIRVLENDLGRGLRVSRGSASRNKCEGLRSACLLQIDLTTYII